MQVKPLLAVGIAAGVAGIGAVNGASATTSREAATLAPTISVRSTAYGEILVNGQGFTVYLWAKDEKDRTRCSGACLGVTPFVLIAGKPTAGPGVHQKLLGTIKVKHGNEVTYNGSPLYTFVADFQPGLILGEGNESFGGPWWVVSPAGHAITKQR